MSSDAVDLKKLKAFQLAARHGSLRVAAARLNLSVSAISLQIRNLETDLGIHLFERLPNRLVITPAGEKLAREIGGIFEHVEQVFTSLKHPTSASGRLQIATSSDIVWYFTPSISTFVKRYPEIELCHHVYNSADTLKLVCKGELDAGIGYFPKIPKMLTKEVIVESGLALACLPGHPLLRRSPRLDILARHKLLLCPRQSATGRLVSKRFAEANVSVRNFIEAGTCHTACAFAERGAGIAIVHSLCLTSHTSRLQSADLNHLFGTVDFSIIYRRSGRLPEGMLGLLEALTSPSAEVQ